MWIAYLIVINDQVGFLNRFVNANFTEHFPGYSNSYPRYFGFIDFNNFFMFVTKVCE